MLCSQRLLRRVVSCICHTPSDRVPGCCCSAFRVPCTALFSHCGCRGAISGCLCAPMSHGRLELALPLALRVPHGAELAWSACGVHLACLDTRHVHMCCAVDARHAANQIVGIGRQSWAMCPPTLVNRVIAVVAGVYPAGAAFVRGQGALNLSVPKHQISPIESLLLLAGHAVSQTQPSYGDNGTADSAIPCAPRTGSLRGLWASGVGSSAHGLCCVVSGRCAEAGHLQSRSGVRACCLVSCCQAVARRGVVV